MYKGFVKYEAGKGYTVVVETQYEVIEKKEGLTKEQVNEFIRETYIVETFYYEGMEISRLY